MAPDDDIDLEDWARGMRPNDVMFVREFLLDMNAYQAAMRCGATEKNAQDNSYKILRRPAIAKGIAAAMTERSQAMRISALTVLGEAFRSYLACVAEGKWSAAAKFLEMCGKHVDVQAFRTQIGLSDPDGEPLQFDLSGLSVDEKRAVLALLEKRSGVEPGGADEGSATIN